MSRRERPLLLAVALLALPAAGPVLGAVYRCEQGGATVYSDKPCAPGAQPVELPKAVVIPAGPREDLLEQARERERRAQRDGEARREAEAAWQAQHAQDKADAARIHQGRAEGRVVEGMTPADVRRIHGEPTVVSRNQKGESNRETWSYLLDGARVTVVFVDGKVDSVRTRESRR